MTNISKPEEARHRGPDLKKHFFATVILCGRGLAFFRNKVEKVEMCQFRDILYVTEHNFCGFACTAFHTVCTCNHP